MDAQEAVYVGPQYVGLKLINARPGRRPLKAGERDDYEAQGRPIPVEDGYIVRYPDGYESWSPKAVFEEAYKPTDAMSFSEALYMLKRGHKIARKGWNGKGLWLELQRPDANSKMTLPYVFICYPDDAQNTPGARVPWLASQTDMLAEDWEVVD